jgi:plastocyanin
MRAGRLIQALLATLLCVSCGGGGSNGGTPTPTPTTPTPPDASVVTITITAANGAQSFSPNPATCATGQTVVWKNADSVTHRVEIDELGVNTGDIAPGATSRPMSLGNVSKGYRCTLHPQMVGALNGAATPAPPGDGPACGPYGC